MAKHPPAAHVYRPDIDGLRAIAVLAVIGFHAGMPLMPGGFVGVDIFFVISGYLISGIIFENLGQGSFSFGDFYARRIRRIFPALILVLLATGIAGWFLLLADEYKGLGKNVAAGSLFISNFSLWRESGYFDTAAKFKPLLHLWSLGIEEQFYIIWPLFLFLAVRWRLNIFGFIAAIAIASFLLNLFRIDNHAAATFFLPATRFWELMAGSLLAWFHQQKTKQPNLPRARFLPDVQSLAGLLMLALSIFLFNEGMPYPGWRALLPVLGTILVIAAGPEAFINRAGLAHRFPVFIGLISYPLYLWHWPLLSYAQIVESGHSTPTVRFALLVLAFLLAWLTYEYVEKKARAAFLQNRKRLTSTLIGLMIVIAASGIVIWQTGGFAFRFPELAAYDAFASSEPRLNWQQDKCFVLPSSPVDAPDAFRKYDCAPATQSGKPLILLVGDSHAAALYPGLVSVFGGKATIGQLTSGFCVPMIEDVQNINIKDGTSRCHEINRYVFSKIRELKPDVLLIAGNYHAYAQDKAWTYPHYLSSMTHDINELAGTGVKNIIVVGQAPSWTAPLPKIVERFIVNGGGVPERSHIGLDDAILATDRYMQKLPWSGNVTYVSLLDRLCDGRGCLIRVGKTLPDGLISIDEGHFSENGSDYVMETVISPVLAQKLK